LKRLRLPCLERRMVPRALPRVWTLASFQAGNTIRKGGECRVLDVLVEPVFVPIVGTSYHDTKGGKQT